MDFIVQLPKTPRGHDAITVFVDKLSKQVHFVPSKTTDTASDVARLFFDNVFRLHGMPTTIVSDRDTKFTSRFWRELHRLLDVKLAMSTAFHPQTDGQTERANQTLEEILQCSELVFTCFAKKHTLLYFLATNPMNHHQIQMVVSPRLSSSSHGMSGPTALE
jgi:transposase InsO family protein